MKLPKPDESNYEKAPTGNHLAICYRVVDLGTQKTNFGDKRQMMFSWELCDEKNSEGEPHTVNSQWMTITGNEKGKMRLMLESWRGRPFSEKDFDVFTIESVLGKPCMLNVTHKINLAKNKEYVEVASIAPVSKKDGPTVPPVVNPCVFFSLDSYDDAVFQALPDYLKRHIVLSPEYESAMHAAGNSFASPSDSQDGAEYDIPF